MVRVKKAHPFGVFPTCREAAVEDDKHKIPFAYKVLYATQLILQPTYI